MVASPSKQGPSIDLTPLHQIAQPKPTSRALLTDNYISLTDVQLLLTDDCTSLTDVQLLLTDDHTSLTDGSLVLTDGADARIVLNR
jgi:hypothetical protein